ncbi:MAG: FAD:protein FMN transferase [Oscillospiraceae bacterium]|nr:FAD:protein FMN transferase [Oscillospiraceae bacterium]
MVKKRISLAMAAVMVLSVLVSCKSRPKAEKHSGVFYNVFDTVITIISYQESDEDFDRLMDYAKDRFAQLDKYYDIYTGYSDINNIKTINDNAGIAPVKVDKEIIDLLDFAVECYGRTEGLTNIAMGSVLKEWHNAREYFESNGEGHLPDIETLRERAEHMDIGCLVIDHDNMTVYITDPQMSLDVGAVAKGYATELVARELAEKYDNFAISAGGTVRTHGTPKDGRDYWSIGIQNPLVDDNFDMIGGNINIAHFSKDMSLVCSGGYQRFMVVDGVRYHHIVDPNTLFPKDIYAGVAILTENSGLADVLSTAVFLMEPDEALNFVNSFEGVECVLTLPDGTNIYSDGAGTLLDNLD